MLFYRMYNLRCFSTVYASCATVTILVFLLW